jgi:putative colanic acid biosynthesis acetyltransferase WcaF
MNQPLDIAANRRAQKWTRREQAGRVLWALAQPLFRFSPRICWGWRRWLLRLFGARVGSQVCLHPSVRVEIPWNLDIGDWSAIGFDALIYNLGPVRIGRRVTVSHKAHLCGGTHDFRDPALPLQKPPITIHDDAWICAEAFVGPGVEVGAGAVVAARAVAVHDVEPWAIVAGNPAVKKGQRAIL